MQDSQLQKAIDLSRKTGDRLIVFNGTESGSSFVVMGLDDYEKLAIGRNEVRGLTERELLDKINRDVAIWKSENEFNDFGEKIGDFKSINDIDNFRVDDFDEYEEDKYYYGDEDDDDEFEDMEDMYREDFSSPNLRKMRGNSPKKKRGFGNNWSIPSDRKRGAEEVDDKEEDRQYLEEIPF